MNQYVTGSMIKKIRESKGLTQVQLAEKMNVSDKAISKWETGRGYPDITLVEPLAEALGISVIELLNGENITNTNRAQNMRKPKFYVCPICGNVIWSSGEAVISCCGIQLPVEEIEDGNDFTVERVEDEYFLHFDHPMTKDHYLSFVAAVRFDSIELVKLYPEGNSDVRFKVRGTKEIYYYCNQHGLYKKKL